MHLIVLAIKRTNVFLFNFHHLIQVALFWCSPDIYIQIISIFHGRNTCEKLTTDFSIEKCRELIFVLHWYFDGFFVADISLLPCSAPPSCANDVLHEQCATNHTTGICHCRLINRINIHRVLFCAMLAMEKQTQNEEVGAIVYVGGRLCAVPGCWCACGSCCGFST